MCLKYMKGMFSPKAVWHSYSLIPWESFYGKRLNFFSGSGNAIFSILLKDLQIDVQIETFAD